MRNLRAEKLNAQGIEAKERGQLDEAMALFREAIQLMPKWSAPHYNLGLVFKLQHDWAESFACNRRATALDSKDQAAWWNLGIAATALGRWNIARQAWRGFGIKVPDGTGPIDFPCGYGPIRLNPSGDAEVVWAHRIDPARALLENIPFPQTNHRWRDIVLNDGAPTGYRQFKGRDVPVFDALELLEPSRFGTYVARVVMPSSLEVSHDEKVVELAQIAAGLGGSAEDWSTSVRMICKACSEGRPHATHDTAAAPADGIHSIGIAATSREHAETILSIWEKEAREVSVEYLEDALEPGPS